MDFIKVKDLEPVKKPGINIKVRVVVKSEPRSVKTKYGLSRVCDFIVGDETGTVTLSLWGSKINDAKFGDIIKLTDGYCNVWQGKAQLSIGRNGVMEIIEDPDFPAAQEILNKYLEESANED